MARTNQTAKQSTGGRAPRKELQTKVARKPQGKRDLIQKTPVSYDNEWLRCSNSAQYRKRQNFFHMETESRPEPAAMTAKEFDAWFDDRIGEQIREFMKKMAGEVLTGA